MRTRLAALLGGFLFLLHVGVAGAQEVIQLSPEALEAIRKKSEMLVPRKEVRRDGLELRGADPEERVGISYHGGGIFVGRFARSVSPADSRRKHWVFQRGVYVDRLGVRYAGTFYFFHATLTESTRKMSDLPEDGTYVMVGSEIRPDGGIRSGIFQARVPLRGQPVNWIPADKEWLASFEESHKEAVAATIRYIRRQQAAARSKAASGFSFGQILALGLGASGLLVADIPAADAVQIGSAFASDVLTGGRTSALNDYVGNQRSKLSAAGSSVASGAAGTGTMASSGPAAAFKSETVSISCPSGSGPHSIPLYYKSQSCRSAMLNYAKVYACNLIDDMQSAAQRCKSACGDIQCREQ